MGERVLDRFELLERLGSGGFGTVYRGWDERLERPVAVKVIEGGDADRPRVLREAQAVARLNHPGIVALYELGDDGTRAYLVSELVEGRTLAELHESGALSDRDVAAIGADLCEALDHAHSRGVVHRDIKPHNVLVSDYTAQAKLMDFGIARLLDGRQLTATGDVVGTIAYMAPEQADGDRVSEPADVYSLALTLYECWTGRNPVAAGSPAATARRLGRRLSPLDRLRPDLPAELSAALDASLDPDPEARVAVGELEDALRLALPLLDEAGGLRPIPAGERLARVVGLPRRPWLIRAAAALALATAATAGLVWVGGSPPSWAYLLPLAAGIVWLGLPRVAYLLASGGLIAWALLGVGHPGVALVLGALLVPPVVLPGAGRHWPAAGIAPLLGALGLAPLYTGIAGIAGRRSRRVGLAVTGYLWLALAEFALGVSLLLGGAGPSPEGWERSATVAGQALLELLLEPAMLLGAVAWVAAALLLPVFVSGRALVLDLLGAMVWGAGVLAAHRLAAAVDGLEHDALSPGGLLAATLLAAALAALWQRTGPPPDRLGTPTLT